MIEGEKNDSFWFVCDLCRVYGFREFYGYWVFGYSFFRKLWVTSGVLEIEVYDIYFD